MASTCMTLGSLFDGIGGFPLAAIRHGIVPLWASEIEAFPISVTKIRFPEMEHFGDITKLKGRELPPVNIVTGGSPCQDISQAGRRAGLAGERSGLFMDQIRIIKEMRDEDERNGRTVYDVRPRYMAWENVPGIFSSGASHGEDFRVVLEETARIADSTVSIPRPPSGIWKPAGAILGDKFSLAWRVLDTQYWPGTPQRRRRIFLIADFSGHSATKILFEQSCLFGDTAPGQKAGEEIAVTTRICTEDTGGTYQTAGGNNVTSTLFAGYGTKWNDNAGAYSGDHFIAAGFCAGAAPSAEGIGYQEECAPTLKGTSSGIGVIPPILCLHDQGGERMDVYDNITGTLKAQEHGHQPIVMATQQGGAEIGFDICPAITSAAGMSGNNQPILYENHSFDSRYTGPHDVSPTIQASAGSGGNNLPLIEQEYETYCIAGNIIGREVENGGNGFGYQPGISYTLNTIDKHAVYSRRRSDLLQPDDITSTQTARQHKDATDLIVNVAGLDCRNLNENGNLCGTLQSKNTGGYSVNSLHPVRTGNLIRRLLPLECERLMGFPDFWTDIPGASDSARYKALGNSVSIPCVEYIMRGIAYFLSQNNDRKESENKKPNMK